MPPTITIQASSHPEAAAALARLTERARSLDPALVLERTDAGDGSDPTLDVAGVDVLTAGEPPDWLLEAALLRALAPRHILFLCVANSARSQMGEGIARALAPAEVRISSAGSEPSFVRPQAVTVLAEIGIDTSTHRSKGTDEIDRSVDAVVTLCAEEVCPVWLGAAWRVHWGLPDPAGAGDSPEGELEAFRSVRDELRRRLAVVFTP